MMRRVRWFGVLFALAQFWLYRPLPGITVPFPQHPVGLAVAGTFAVINLLSYPLARRSGRAWQVVADALAISAVVWLFAFDQSSALWALMVLPVLHGALRAQLRGALFTWGGLSLLYVARELWASRGPLHLPLYPDSIGYRLGIVFLVAIATGSLADRLHAIARRLGQQLEATQRALAEADGLRMIAAAGRRMTTLDRDTVLAETVTTGGELGFSRVLLCLPAEGGWAVAADLADDGDREPTVAVRELVQAARLAAERREPVLLAPESGAPATRAVAIAIVAGAEVGAVLVAVSDVDDVVPEHRSHALELLAAQAGAALTTTQRYDERRAFQRRLEHQALHDALTGLPNRVLFQDRATQALAGLRRSKLPVTILLLDLDRFKEINDTLGHSYGDVLLQQVAGRLRTAVRGADTAARLSGDEFAVLATLPDVAAAVPLAERVRAALHEPFVADGVTLDVEASIGIAIAPDHGEDVDSLLRRADIAMYVAKNTGSGMAVYDPRQDEHTPDRLALLGELRRAVDSPDQLVLHYQPKIGLVSDLLVGVEALLRWQHPTRGLLPPGEFIPAAESTGLIHPLTTRVLDAALRQVRSWLDAGHAVPVAVNVSARSLLDLGFAGQVTDLLAAHRVPAAMLRLEITETTLMADPHRARTVLAQLHDAGVRLSIDDFGTGYSSMSYLKQLPVDELKVHRGFVKDMRADNGDAMLVRSVIELGHNLGLTIVAEGVEDAETMRLLGDLGCDIAQGYHLGRPVAAPELDEWLAPLTRSPRAAAAG